MNPPSELAFAIRDHLMTRIPAQLRTADQSMLLGVIQDAIVAHGELAERNLPTGHAEIQAAKEAKVIPPTLHQVTALLKKMGSDLEAVDFMDHYNANGWLVGRVKMKDWHSALNRAHRTWGRPKRSATEPGELKAKAITEWERKQKADRAADLRTQLRELTHPGGSAYSVELSGEKRAQANVIIGKLSALRVELAQ